MAINEETKVLIAELGAIPLIVDALKRYQNEQRCAEAAVVALRLLIERSEFI